jgi:hypothetical protein
MDTQEFVLKIFLIYIFIKALVLCPLGWMTLCVWWNDRQEAKRAALATSSLPTNSDDLVATPQLEAA